jgi:hypothetical protein
VYLYVVRTATAYKFNGSVSEIIAKTFFYIVCIDIPVAS